jgi:hypothetical protein
MKLNELIKKKLSTIGLHDEVLVNYDINKMKINLFTV